MLAMMYVCVLQIWSFVLFSPFPPAQENLGYANILDVNELWNDTNQEFSLWTSIITWSYPETGLHGLDGLYGGLTWALNPNLCDSLIPSFADADYWFVRNSIRDLLYFIE